MTNDFRRSSSRTNDVIAFLQGSFHGARISVSEITRKATAVGLIGDRQSVTNSKLFKSAKVALGIRSVRDGFAGEGEWFWVLPDQTTSAAVAPVHVSAGLDASRVTYVEDPFDTENVPSLPPATTTVANDEPPETVDTSAPSAWVEGTRRLSYQHAPSSVPLHRWQRFVNDCHEFMTASENWAARASTLGWDDLGLFGCRPTRPLDHLGSAGLLWNLAGGKLTHLRTDWAMLTATDGSQRSFHRRPSSPHVTLPWRLR